MGNRLARESSPYLLEHAENPVDWYPWGPEALARARTENKPILLSVGYSACHWCHVMARESFEDPETAAQMTQRGPKARLIEIAEVGHAPTLMHADQIALVREFLLQGEQQ